MNRYTRIVSFLLCCAMVLPMLPAAAAEVSSPAPASEPAFVGWQWPESSGIKQARELDPEGSAGLAAALGEDAWVLLLEGVSEEMPVMKEQLEMVLPQTVTLLQEVPEETLPEETTAETTEETTVETTGETTTEATTETAEATTETAEATTETTQATTETTQATTETTQATTEATQATTETTQATQATQAPTAETQSPAKPDEAEGQDNASGQPEPQNLPAPGGAGEGGADGSSPAGGNGEITAFAGGPQLVMLSQVTPLPGEQPTTQASAPAADPAPKNDLTSQEDAPKNPPENDLEKAPTSQEEAPKDPADKTVPLNTTFTLDWSQALADYPAEGIWQGKRTLTPILSPAREAVQPPELVVVFGQLEVIDEISSTVLENNQVDNKTETPGTVIHVFDYWTNPQEDGRILNDVLPMVNNTHLWNSRINQGHSLKFGKNMGGYLDQIYSKDKTKERYNRWMGADTLPYQGIMNPTLGGDGYPMISDKDGLKSESAAYLFSPTKGHNGKKSFTNVTGLIQIDEKNGYYYYDSQKNYAYLDEPNNRFILYNQPAVKFGERTESQGSTADQWGQFFPFTAPGKVFVESETAPGTLDGFQLVDALWQKDTDETGEALNHYFGLTMSTRFVQKNNGLRYYTENEPIIYDFSGDDDVWVYIDDVLVADLGGIHDRASLDINFNTGNITITVGNENMKSTLRKQFAAAGRENSTSWNDQNDQTFANDTYHTLQFFYLERGNDASNLSLKYNLISFPESEIEKVDQLGNPVREATFTLYTADDSFNTQTEVFTGTTDGNGRLHLQEDGLPITFQELYKKHDRTKFVLKEVALPTGYRSPNTSNASVALEYDPATNVILSVQDNYWDTGTYAAPKETFVAPAILYEAGVAGAQGNPFLDLTKKEDMERLAQGTLFVVVLKRDMRMPYNDVNAWHPIVGSYRYGWEVIANQGSALKNVIAAAQQEAADTTDGSPVFVTGTDGAYRATLTNLPGNIRNYYWYMHQLGQENEYAQRAEYTTAFYYTSGNLSEANEENTVRLSPANFQREFSVRLYVPNIRNHLVVQKVDENNNKLTGAEFTLYKAKADGTGPDPSQAVDKVTTKDHLESHTGWITIQGAGLFPSDKQHHLTPGTYFLVETKAPTGYQLNDTPVKVVVNEYGVFANAGTADDGIKTFSGAGSLVASLAQFALGNQVDATLYHIQMQLQRAKGNMPPVPGSEEGWSDWDNTAETVQLQYDESRELDYIHYVSTKEGTRPFLSNDVGWSELYIRQDQLGNTQQGPKVDLQDRNLRNLFATVMCVQVTDQVKEEESASLSVRKQLTGEQAETDRPFSFTVNLFTDEAMITPASTVNGTFSGPEGTIPMTFQSGSAQFQLKGGQTAAAIAPQLVGLYYRVTEEKTDGYQTSYDIQASGQLTAESPVVTTVTNQRIVGGLTVSKTVSGTGGSGVRDFRFTLTLTDSQNSPLTGSYGGVQFNSKGQYTFTLKHGGSQSFTGIPSGSKYQVTEAPVQGYTTTVTNASGTIEGSTSVAVSFTNTWSGTQPDKPTEPTKPSEPVKPGKPGDPNTPSSGDNSHVELWRGLLILSGLALAVAFAPRRKRYRGRYHR